MWTSVAATESGNVYNPSTFDFGSLKLNGAFLASRQKCLSVRVLCQRKDSNYMTTAYSVALISFQTLLSRGGLVYFVRFCTFIKV